MKPRKSTEFEDAAALARIHRISDRLEAVGLLTDVVVPICREHRVTITQVLGLDRHRGPAAARRAIWYAIRHSSEREWSYPEIARLFDVDHTSIMTGVACHARRLAESEPARCAPAGDARCE